MWALLDNYDSFTYILHHYLLQLHKEVIVFKNDAIEVSDLIRLKPKRLIVSPGPKRPQDAGITMEAIRQLHDKIPILGVCLGHQALGQFFGAELVKGHPMHGKTSTLHHQQKDFFANIPSCIQVMRYHSLVLQNWENTGIVPLAFSDTMELMAFCHPVFPCVGLQFHPESVLTEFGFEMLENWARNES
jgi:anthranilate synthase/aminodeoxychorismate synthase-like glutamine amidotransferase